MFELFISLFKFSINLRTVRYLITSVLLLFKFLFRRLLSSFWRVKNLIIFELLLCFTRLILLGTIAVKLVTSKGKPNLLAFSHQAIKSFSPFFNKTIGPAKFLKSTTVIIDCTHIIKLSRSKNTVCNKNIG